MTSIFNAYAQYYDLLYSDKDYSKEAQYVDSLVKARHPNPSTILELGCGTGAHAECLANMGYTVHGIDQSSEMIAKANDRKAELPKEIRDRLYFEVADAQNVALTESFDTVISLFHVISYQTKTEEVNAMVHTAFSHLKTGGVFIFDYWYGPAVLGQGPQVRVKRLQNENIRITRIAEPVVRSRLNRVDVNYSIFIEDLGSDKIVQIKETHHMRYFFLPELQELFPPHKWKDCESLAWLSNAKLSNKDWAGVSSVVKA